MGMFFWLQGTCAFSCASAAFRASEKLLRARCASKIPQLGGGKRKVTDTHGLHATVSVCRQDGCQTQPFNKVSGF